MSKLKGLIETNKDKVVAIGECGLDYDRLNFCQTDVQKKYFEAQLDLSGLFELPLFLHCRAAASDMLEILKKVNRERYDIVSTTDLCNFYGLHFKVTIIYIF